RSPGPRTRPRVASLLMMSRCGRPGPSTDCEASLHPSGTCRSGLHPRLHRGSFAAGCAAVQARIKQIIDLLLIHPRLGARTDDPAVRRVTTTPYPYLVFYETTETEITIHAVRHAARDPSGMPGSR